jgi:uncharacterized membrane protein
MFERIKLDFKQLEASIHDNVWLRSTYVLIGLGIMFRCANLNQKVFGADEVATALQIAGWTKQQLAPQLTEGQLLTPAQLLQFQQLSSGKPLWDVIPAFLQRPEHPPLYFALTRLWTEVFGASAIALRSFSVVVSLLAFRYAYALCVALFESARIGLLAVGLLAISPVFIDYAQQARPFSLWLFVSLWSGTALLQALWLNTPKTWTIYTVSLALNLYTSLLTLPVLLGHFIYVLFRQKRMWSTVTQNFCRSAAYGGLAFLPWLGVMVYNWQLLQENISWMQEPIDFMSRIGRGFYTLVVVFFSVPIAPVLSIWFLGQVMISLLMVSILIFSLIHLCQRSPLRIWLFVVSLAVCMPLILVLGDLLIGGQHSAISPYFLPTQVGMLLSVAHLLTRKWFSSQSTTTAQLWRWVVIALIGVSFVSSVSNMGRLSEYLKTRNAHNLEIATIVNQADAPLLIAERYWDWILDLMSLSHNLDPDVGLQILPSDRIMSDVNLCQQPTLVLNPSPDLTNQFQSNQRAIATQVYSSAPTIPSGLTMSLWRLQTKDCNSSPDYWSLD